MSDFTHSLPPQPFKGTLDELIHNIEINLVHRLGPKNSLTAINAIYEVLESYQLPMDIPNPAPAAHPSNQLTKGK